MTLKCAWLYLANVLSNNIPRRLAFGLADRIADIQWRCSRKDRLIVQSNLSLVVGFPVDEKSALVREVFHNFGRYLVEFFTMHCIKESEFSIEGREYLLDAHRCYGSAILLSAHFGNWELGAAIVRRLGFPVTTVVLSHGDYRVDRLFNNQRRRCGIDIIPLGKDAAKQSLRALRGGCFLGILGDREFTTQQAISVTLCGHKVNFPRGPAALSLRSQLPVVPTFIVRDGFYKFRMHFEPPILPNSVSPKETAILELTQSYGSVMERYLKHFPSQWLMFQSIADGLQIKSGVM